MVITENNVKELIKGDPDNLELVLDIVAVLNDNQKIIVRPGILAEAIENLEPGFKIGKRNLKV